MEKLRQSVVQKRLQLQKEKLEMKLNLILHSQVSNLSITYIQHNMIKCTFYIHLIHDQ